MKTDRAVGRRLLPFVVMVAAITVALCGCGGSSGQGGSRSVDEFVVVRGKLTELGGTPFSLLALETQSGKVYMIEQSSLAEELRTLTEMEVSVRGKVLRDSADEPALDVISYDLLALPSGEVPIVGVIRSGGLIEDTNLVTWVIQGDFETLLQTFVGAKVWIVGVPMQSVDRPDATYRAILVTEYGVIRP